MVSGSSLVGLSSLFSVLCLFVLVFSCVVVVILSRCYVVVLFCCYVVLLLCCSAVMLVCCSVVLLRCVCGLLFRFGLLCVSVCVVFRVVVLWCGLCCCV